LLLYEYRIKIKSLLIWAAVQMISAGRAKGQFEEGREKRSEIDRTEKEGMKKRQRCGHVWTLKPIKLYERCIMQRDGGKNKRS
jgi:hypothetical protein